MKKSEPFYLIEKLQGSNGEPAEWFIGPGDDGWDQWTTSFNEVPEAWKFPTWYHASAIWDTYVRHHGSFKEQGYREYKITEHAYVANSESAAINATPHDDLRAAAEAYRVTKHDYIEDFADEDNGNYQHQCRECDAPFRGHKRRISTCKSCHLTYLEGMAREINLNPASTALKAAIANTGERTCEWVKGDSRGKHKTACGHFTDREHGVKHSHCSMCGGRITDNDLTANIESATKSFEGVDTDEFLDEMRGREK